MPVSAICPNCNVPNEPTAVQCTICKTALGAMLVGDARDGLKWFVSSSFISLGMYLLCMLFGLHAMTIIVPVFYGPLLASYFARSNVVWASALGGMALLLFVLIVALLDSESHTARQVITQLEGGKPDHIATGAKLLFGMIVAGLVALPIALTGASVGEHLSVRRRRKPTQLGSA
jgi:hypothetical protein